MPAERLTVVVPELGLGLRALVASLWLVEPGSEVTAGDRLLEILAGEATVDLSAPATGIFVEALVDDEQPVTVGQPVAVIETAQGDRPE
jgi:pyruvate/2-oxoglutarate dehydrogenase complex dihydrolipoamide acyltransferase (E2) component